jgi:hypothetical protein
VIRRIWFIAAITLLVAACGDDDDSSVASTSTVPATTVAPPTTVPATTAPPGTSPGTSVAKPGATASAGTTTIAVGCTQPPAFDPNGSLRDQFVTYLVGCGFTQSEAGCLFGHLDFADPAVLAGDPDAMLPAFEACDIDADRMAEIGAP